MAYQAMTLAHFKESTYGEALDAMRIANEAGKSEPGCMYYNVFESTNAPFTTVTVEMWRDHAAFQDHCNGSACQKLGEVLDRTLESVEVHEGECLF